MPSLLNKHHYWHWLSLTHSRWGAGAQQCRTVKCECCDMGSVSWQGGGAANSGGSPFLLSLEGTLPRFSTVSPNWARLQLCIAIYSTVGFLRKVCAC